jgi:hypothetical protein
MKSLHRIAFVVLFAAPLLVVHAQNFAGLRGAWELKSQKIDGKEQVLTGKRLRILSDKHFVWVNQDKKKLEELLAKHTPHDSVVAYHDDCGAGTYKVQGDIYTETTEVFYDPQNIGTSIDWKFRLDGDLWYTTGHYLHYSNGKKDEDLLLEEVWKKLD